ncbi:helix-turn-helix transcriptional regulator [Methylobacterium sp. NEAU 140]|uniref:helix-turn-helix domain-containing protein n=1 Tax=Methylobacterium sp. NEAU 140 TaxID=3064945 RepID=UPI002733A526|nr:helix-turn-helix transcriptional regulator [Methylobacterium sp. NEAU 140]MDP4024006.1 helix-turn-helix transcriptional regulator [Methylobacterium sp. NEAU 140]
MDRSQLRAARALLGWSQERLAEASGVSVPTIKRLEPGEGVVRTRVQTLMKLRSALEAAGIAFTDGDEPGVRRVRKP